MKKQNFEREAWISRLAECACLRLTEEERGLLAERVLNHLRTLEDLPDLLGEENSLLWAEEAVGLEALREDDVGVCLPREALLSAASCAHDGFFAVPRMLAEETDV